jgi:hypothetical protein
MRRIFLTASIAFFGLLTLIFLVRSSRRKQKEEMRNAGYQAILATYTRDLAPGMTRKPVEEYLKSRGVQFQQASLGACAAWTDWVKIAEEDAPWVCSEHNIYIAFDFQGKNSGQINDASPTDILTKIYVKGRLEGCL